MRNFLILILIFALGILLGILFSEEIFPKIGSVESPIETPQKKEVPILCKEVKEGIEVDLTRQKLRMCKGGEALEELVVSTGKRETQTPAGDFAVLTKSAMLYSKIAKSWLPFWVGFSGDYGFHELPIDEQGSRVGEDKIGKPDSLGCVRLKVGDAQKVYKFAKIGMKIAIFGETP